MRSTIPVRGRKLKVGNRCFNYVHTIPVRGRKQPVFIAINGRLSTIPVRGRKLGFCIHQKKPVDTIPVRGRKSALRCNPVRVSGTIPVRGQTKARKVISSFLLNYPHSMGFFSLQHQGGMPHAHQLYQSSFCPVERRAKGCGAGLRQGDRPCLSCHRPRHQRGRAGLPCHGICRPYPAP